MGNCSQKEITEAKRREENEKLQQERAQAQLRKPITLLLVGEENSGKDTICLQLLKKAKQDAGSSSLSENNKNAPTATTEPNFNSTNA